MDQAVAFITPVLASVDQLLTRPNLIVLFISIYSICLHEAAHAYAADWYGDPTPRALGFRTVDPVRHMRYSPFSTVLLPIITWFLYQGRWVMGGGACPVSWQHLRRHRWGVFWVTAAGPAVNLLLGMLALIPMLLFPADSPWLLASARLVVMQLVIAVFNLLPIPPMDGSHMLACAYPPLRSKFDQWGQQFGMALPVIIGWSVMMNFAFEPIYDFVGWVRPEALELLIDNW